MTTLNLFLNNNNSSESIDELKELLNSAGIAFSVEEVGGNHVACFKYEEKEFIRKQTRYAGRPELITDKKYTMGDIRKMKAEMTADQMAEILHLSKRTIFRRLKNHRLDPDSFLF